MLALLACLLSTPVMAQAVCRTSGPYIALTFDGDWAEGSRGAVTAELRAALAVQDIALCLASPRTEQALARLFLTRRQAPSGPVVDVVVRDRVTDKSLERAVELASFGLDPNGGAPIDSGAEALVVAIAADELLRASWIELAMEDAPEPAIAPPPQVTETVRRSVRTPTQRRRSQIDVVAALDAYAGGEVQLGGSVGVELPLANRLSLRLRLGGRRGLRRRGVLGSVQSQTLLGELDGVVRVLGAQDGPSLGAQVGVAGGALWFDAQANEVGTASAQRAGLLIAQLGLRFGWPLGSVRLVMDGGVAFPILGAVALDGASALSGVEGVGGFLRLGIGLGP